MEHIQTIIIVVIILTAIILIVLNQNLLGFNNKSKSKYETNRENSINTSNGPLICPYNSESEKNTNKPLSLSDGMKKLNNINVPIKDSSYTLEQVFGINGAKSQLLTEARYSNPNQLISYDNADDYVPKSVLDSLVTQEDLRYGNPDVDGYSICDVNPSDDDGYYDPKLMNIKLKSTSDPLILSISDETELVGEIDDIIRGSNNPLPGPYSGKYKKCNKI